MVQVFALYLEHGPYGPVAEDINDLDPGTNVHGQVSVTVIHEENEPRYLDVSVEDGFEITAVIVKGGPNSNIYFDTLTGLHAPLSGRVLWAGAVVDEVGNPLDWPGWTQLDDGTWVEGDEFDRVRPAVDVLFEVNPEVTITVDYPPSSPDCNANPQQPPGEQPPGAGPDLPKTGGSSGLLALLGALLLAGGAALAYFGRRFARGTITGWSRVQLGRSAGAS